MQKWTKIKDFVTSMHLFTHLFISEENGNIQVSKGHLSQGLSLPLNQTIPGHPSPIQANTSFGG